MIYGSVKHIILFFIAHSYFTNKPLLDTSDK